MDADLELMAIEMAFKVMLLGSEGIDRAMGQGQPPPQSHGQATSFASPCLQLRQEF